MKKFCIEQIYDDGDTAPFVPVNSDLTPAEIKNPAEIVSLERKVSILFNYPLSTSAIFTFTRKNAHTIYDFYRYIRDSYRKIYNEEEKGLKRKPKNIEGMYNREKSDGKYGIWGHVIDDLVIEEVYWDVKAGLWSLHIGS